MMEEQNKKIVSKKEKPRILVVKELPMEPVRHFTKDGIEYDVMTVEEALEDLLNS